MPAAAQNLESPALQSNDRARWVADLAIAYGERMTDGERLRLLGLYYDQARNQGISEGIDRLAARLAVAS